MGNIIGDLIHAPRGRLTLETGVAISTSDQTAKTTIYFTPYKGNTVPIYDTSASVWTILEFSEISLSLAGFTANKNSDVFVYNNAGTLAMERVEWTNDSTRATAIALQDGRYIKSGDASRLYVGTFRTTGTIGQCEDSLTRRLVWNYYNRVEAHLYKAETTSHNYTTATWRYWNNDSTQQVDLVIGVQEDAIKTAMNVNMRLSSGTVTLQAAVGLDSATAPAVTDAFTTRAGTENMYSHAVGHAFPAAGYHYFAMAEYGGANATQAAMYARVFSKR